MDIASIFYEAQVKPNTYCLVTRRTWRELKNLFDSHFELSGASKVSKVEMVYHYANGSKIYFSMINDNWLVDKHAGMYYDFMDIDSIDGEYAAQLLKRIRPDGLRKIQEDL